MLTKTQFEQELEEMTEAQKGAGDSAKKVPAGAGHTHKDEGCIQVIGLISVGGDRRTSPYIDVHRCTSTYVGVRRRTST